LALFWLAGLALFGPGCVGPAMVADGPRPQIYYYFLKAQYEEMERRDDEAVKSLRQAVSLAGEDSYYLRVELAKLLSRSGRVDEAQAYLAKAIEMNPNDPETRLFAAWLAAATGQWPEAENQYVEALRLDPHNEEALSYLGALYAESGRLEEAHRAFRRLGSRAPGSFLPDYFLGRLSQKKGETREAIGHFQRALAKNPGFVSALTELAILYEQTGQTALAEKSYRQLIKTRPEANMPKARLSRILLKSGRRQEAINLLRDISGQAQDQAQAGILIGLVFIEESMLPEAEAEFKSVLKTSPDNDQARYLLASVCLERGQQAEAKELLARIPARSEQFVDARIFLSSILVKDNQLGEALSLLKAARREAPGAPQLLVANAILLESLTRLTEARETYLEGLKRFPDSAEIHFRLGVLDNNQGRASEGLKSVRRAVTLDPNFVDALNYLAYTWAERRENLNEALILAIRANNLRPDNGHIIDTLGWIYFMMDDVKKALPLLERAARLSNFDPIILEHLGDALAKAGRWNDARRAYDRAIRQSHENPEKIHEKMFKLSR
jgi:tetratricopeptide (TPR) repeat protein